MGTIAISPVTIAALNHLSVHGITSMPTLRASVPSLQAKTMANLVQLGHALKSEAGYQITPKGRAKLKASEQPTQHTGNEDGEHNTLAAAAAPAAPPPQAAPMLSNAEVETAITAVLQRTRVRISLQDIGRRTWLAEHIVRPTLTTMIQQGTVEGTSTKPPLYRLAKHITRQHSTREHNTHLGGGPRAHLGSSDYTCPELQRNPGIGAERFAAFHLPSRMGNRLHHPDGRVEPMPDMRAATA